MNILFLITGLDYGGAEILLVTNCNYLIKQGYTVKVVTIITPKALVKDLNGLGIEVESLNIKKYSDLPGAFLKYNDILKKFKPGIIHAHMVHANLFSRLAVFLFGKKAPLVNTSHDPNFKKNFFRNFMYRITNWAVDYVTAISIESYNNYCLYTGINKKKISCLDNFIDADKFDKNNFNKLNLKKKLGIEKKFAWIAIGSFYEQKDYPNLLNAFSLLIKDCKEVILLILGRGPLEDMITSEINNLEIKDYVQLLGVRENIPEFLCASDAFVMSSAWEGQSIALLEAAACSLPIVATDVGGNSTVVKQSNGFLVKPKNYRELYNGMAKIMNMSEADLSEMGKQSRVIIEQNYSIEKIGKRFAAIYCNLIERKNKL